MNRRAFVLGAIMVLLGSVAAVALRSFAETAFLSAYGPRLMPWLPIANATSFAVATLGYDALTRGARGGRADVVLLAALALAAALTPSLLAAGAPPAALVVGLAASSQVAGLALWNRVCAAVAGRDARRNLPRAGAAVTLGGAFAGLGASALIPRVGLPALPYLGAVVTLVALGVCLAQERALVLGGAPGGAPGGPGTTPDGARPRGPTGTLAPLHRPLVAAMIAVAALEGVVATAVELQFLTAVKARFSGQDLAVALSLFYGVTHAVLFVLQSAAVPRLLVSRAMTFTAAVHPAVVVLAYAGFAAAPGFLGIAATRTADQVLRFATSRTSQELELSALPPALRARWKVLLRGAVGPAGAALAALVLLLTGPIARGAHAPLAIAAISVAVAWGVVARIAARRFQAALAAPLGIRTATRPDPRLIDLDTLARWTQVTGADDPSAAALARAALARARVSPADLADHLRHDEPSVRAALFGQLAHTPAPSLRAELRAAVAIEDDDRALALGIRALAVAGDDAGLERGQQREGLSREVDAASATARVMLHAGDAVSTFARLLATDPAWACELARARADQLTPAIIEEQLRAAEEDPRARAGSLLAIVRLVPDRCAPMLSAALERSDAAAFQALAELDAELARQMSSSLAGFSTVARVALARALGAVPAAAPLVAALACDADPEVAHAALRSALAIARGGGELPADRVAAAHDAALAAMAAHLDAREASAASPGWLSPCAAAELEVATRRCAARLLWAAALEAAAAGQPPSPIAAVARHLVGARDADRRRALDVVQELRVRPVLLVALERWLQPPRPRPDPDAVRRLATFDPWIGRVLGDELAPIEPALVDLRRAPLFAPIAGPALAELAARGSVQEVASELFRQGDPGDSMYLVTRGAVVARRDGQAGRRLGPGELVGEIAVLARAPRVATVTAADEGARVFAIERSAFEAAARRAPELVLEMSASLAGWLAPDRPDVL